MVDGHVAFSDHSVGFGGKFGIQKDRVDECAKGWSEQTTPAQHASQTDHKKGFGGKFGVEDRKDESAHGFGGGQSEGVGTNYQKTKPDTAGK